jgi:phosphate-selective porin
VPWLIQVTEGLYLGYGYDLRTTKPDNYNSGSHEIFLRYNYLEKIKNDDNPKILLKIIKIKI